MITTRLTEMFGIAHPIVLAPMDTVADAQLALAVSAAGGLGLLGGGYGDRGLAAALCLRADLTEARTSVTAARDAGDYRIANVIVCEGVGVVDAVESAATIIDRTVRQARDILDRGAH